MQQIPEITINHDLMATLTGAIWRPEYVGDNTSVRMFPRMHAYSLCQPDRFVDEQKEELVAADPRKTFRFNQITKQARDAPGIESRVGRLYEGVCQY